MDVADLSLNGVDVWVSRSGYTGEDGYEISVPAAQMLKRLARALCWRMTMLNRSALVRATSAA